MKPRILIRRSDGEKFIRTEDGNYALEHSLSWKRQGHLILTYPYEVLMNGENKGQFVPEDEYINETSLFPEAIKLMKLRHRLERYFRSIGVDHFNTSVAKEIVEDLEKIEMELYKS